MGITYHNWIPFVDLSLNITLSIFWAEIPAPSCICLFCWIPDQNSSLFRVQGVGVKKIIRISLGDDQHYRWGPRLVKSSRCRKRNSFGMMFRCWDPGSDPQKTTLERFSCLSWNQSQCFLNRCKGLDLKILDQKVNTGTNQMVPNGYWWILTACFPANSKLWNAANHQIFFRKTLPGFYFFLVYVWWIRFLWRFLWPYNVTIFHGMNPVKRSPEAGSIVFVDDFLNPLISPLRPRHLRFWSFTFWL